jgi:hypothetical protein
VSSGIATAGGLLWVATMDDETIRRRLVAALGERHARTAFGIGACIRSALDVLDEQPPSVIEALIDEARDLQKPGSSAPRHRYKVRAAIIEYCEERLQTARELERELFRGITGLDEPPGRVSRDPSAAD